MNLEFLVIKLSLDIQEDAKHYDIVDLGAHNRSSFPPKSRLFRLRKPIKWQRL